MLLKTFLRLYEINYLTFILIYFKNKLKTLFRFAATTANFHHDGRNNKVSYKESNISEEEYDDESSEDSSSG